VQVARARRHPAALTLDAAAYRAQLGAEPLVVKCPVERQRPQRAFAGGVGFDFVAAPDDPRA